MNEPVTGPTKYMDFKRANVDSPVSLKRARVVWADGYLYAMTTPSAPATIIPCPEQPASNSDNPHTRSWGSVTEDGEEVSINQRGCSTCGGGKLIRMSTNEFLTLATNSVKESAND